MKTSATQVKIKLLHPYAKIPTRKYEGDAGYDLYSVEDKVIPPWEIAEVHTGIAIEIPKGFYAEIHSRSGLRRKGIVPPVGIIDQGYRGDLRVILYNFTGKAYSIKKGDRIAQLILKPRIEVSFLQVDQLSPSERSNHGFGSTGK